MRLIFNKCSAKTPDWSAMPKQWCIGDLRLEPVIYEDMSAVRCHDASMRSKEPQPTMTLHQSGHLTQVIADQAARSIYGLSVKVSTRKVHLDTIQRISCAKDGYELLESFVEALENIMLRQKKATAKGRAARSNDRHYVRSGPNRSY